MQHDTLQPSATWPKDEQSPSTVRLPLHGDDAFVAVLDAWRVNGLVETTGWYTAQEEEEA